MPEPVLDPAYWAKRLADAKELHHSIFKCPLDRWLAIEAKHREILTQHVNPMTTVLDVGCGYGRLVGMLPPHLLYVGIDISPELVDLARASNPDNLFLIKDARDLGVSVKRDYDLAVMVSFRPMIRRNCGDGVWAEMEREIRKVAKKLLYLEYDVNDEGSVE